MTHIETREYTHRCMDMHRKGTHDTTLRITEGNGNKNFPKRNELFAEGGARRGMEMRRIEELFVGVFVCVRVCSCVCMYVCGCLCVLRVRLRE